MTYAVTPSIEIGPDATRVDVRVWRLVAGAPQWLFSYAGAIDDAVLGAVMLHVQRLTSAVPGDWRIEVVGAGRPVGGLRAPRGRRAHVRRARMPRAGSRLSLALASAPSLLLH